MDDTGHIDFDGVLHMLTPKLKDKIARVTTACETKRMFFVSINK